MDNRLISIVIPVYNEEGSLEALLREIDTVSKNNNYNFQIILVDDGSRDRSWPKIVELAANDPRIGGLRFRRNAGKAAALMAGFAAAEGELVFMMDADLQDPPVEIPRFLETIDRGYDLVSGWKQKRYDPWHKVYPSRVFNAIIGLLTGVRIHDHVCGFKCMRRAVAKELKLYGEFHRFVAVFAAANGGRVTEIATLHRPRTTGVGKYGFSRFGKGFVDLLTVWFITRYRWRPQHPIGVAGLLMIPLGLLAMIPFIGWPFLFLLRMAAVSLPLLAMAMIAHLIVAQRPLDDLYEITDRAGWCAGAAG